jgi:hypothetical protein
MMIFVAQLEIAKDDRHFSACSHKDDKSQQQESENVVVLAQPDGRVNEKQLHEYSAERQDTSN